MKFSFPCAPVVSWEELAREQSISLASGFAFGFTTKPPLRSASGMLALLYRASGSDSGVHSKRVATLKEGPIGIRDSCAAYASFISADPSLPGVAALAGSAVLDSTMVNASKQELKRFQVLVSIGKIHPFISLFSGASGQSLRTGSFWPKAPPSFPTGVWKAAQKTERRR